MLSIVFGKISSTETPPPVTSALSNPSKSEIKILHWLKTFPISSISDFFICGKSGIFSEPKTFSRRTFTKDFGRYSDKIFIRDFLLCLSFWIKVATSISGIKSNVISVSPFTNKERFKASGPLNPRWVKSNWSVKSLFPAVPFAVMAIPLKLAKVPCHKVG